MDVYFVPFDMITGGMILDVKTFCAFVSNFTSGGQSNCRLQVTIDNDASRKGAANGIGHAPKPGGLTTSVSGPLFP